MGNGGPRNSAIDSRSDLESLGWEIVTVLLVSLEGAGRWSCCWFVYGFGSRFELVGCSFELASTTVPDTVGTEKAASLCWVGSRQRFFGSWGGSGISKFGEGYFW